MRRRLALVAILFLLTGALAAAGPAAAAPGRPKAPYPSGRDLPGSGECFNKIVSTTGYYANACVWTWMDSTGYMRVHASFGCHRSSNDAYVACKRHRVYEFRLYYRDLGIGGCFDWPCLHFVDPDDQYFDDQSHSDIWSSRRKLCGPVNGREVLGEVDIGVRFPNDVVKNSSNVNGAWVDPC
jgi:hypothetical protein